MLDVPEPLPETRSAVPSLSGKSLEEQVPLHSSAKRKRTTSSPDEGEQHRKRAKKSLGGGVTPGDPELPPIVLISDQNAPSPMIVKASYPLSSHQVDEATMFQDLGKDCIIAPSGVIKVYGSERILHNGQEDSHVADTKYWNVFGPKPTTIIGPEQRIPQRRCMQEGKALTEAKGPRQLAKCIHHALIGLYSLFRAGYVHRDLSTRNILLLPEAEQRDCFQEFGHSIEWCTGVIVDCEQAIKWNVGRDQATSRSGTLAFLSVRLLQALANRDQFRHTPIDDLEACLWVMIGAALVVGEEKQPDVLTKSWIRHMEAEPNATPSKIALLNLSFNTSIPWSIQPLRDLIIKLSAIIFPAQQKAVKVMETNLENDSMLGLATETFGKVLIAMNETVDTLPEDWIAGRTSVG